MGHSNSSIKSYEQCPFKYKLTRIEKRQEPSGPAAERGTMIHAEFETALGALNIIPDERKWWFPYIDELKAKGALSEVEFAINRNWVKCDFKDPDYWLRGIYDAIYFEGTKAHVLDWKTGKERDYEDQLKLYAAIILATYMDIEEVTTEICFIDLNKRVQYATHSRADLPALQQWIGDRIAKIEKDDIFSPKPSFNCKWCHFRKSNGGPCQW